MMNLRGIKLTKPVDIEQDGKKILVSQVLLYGPEGDDHFNLNLPLCFMEWNLEEIAKLSPHDAVKYVLEQASDAFRSLDDLVKKGPPTCDTADSKKS